MYRLRYLMFATAALAAVFFSAFAVGPAYADEGTPPPPAEETSRPPDSGEGQESAPPVEPTAGEEAASPVDSNGDRESASPVEPTDGEEAAPPVDSNGDGESAPPIEESAVPPSEEIAPESSPVVVVNEQGEILPLASQEAAEVIANNDPMWCPVGVAPGGAGCTAATNSFAAMLTNLTGMYGATGPAKAGIIWIAAGYDSSVDDPGALNFTLDGSVLTTMRNYGLTINGGWSGTGTTLNSADPSEFNAPFSIINWNAPIAINNLLITGAGGTDYALRVTTTGSIAVNNTEAVSNASSFGGAHLDNTGGSGNVSVANSAFSNNSGAQAWGLEIYSKGTVTLKDVDASGNTLNGAYIRNDAASTPKAVTVAGANTFNGNGTNGLTILSRGAVTMSNITATGNSQTGVYVDNCYFDFTTGLCTLYSGGSGVTLNGVNTFIGNAFEGLRVWSGGAIAVSNVAAHGNGFSGSRAASTYVDPDAIPANGDEFYAYDAEGKGVFLHNFGAASAKPVTVSGTNIFSNNASSGLFVYTKGFFTGNNLTASFNGCNPAFDIADQYCAGVFIYSESGVKQTGYASFSSNNREGLEVWNNVRGWVWLNNLDAQGNGTSSQSGVYVQAYNPALAIPVAITGVNFFRGNNYNGLHINASGAVSLYNATSNSNIGGSGISVDNRSPFKAPVTFLGLTSTESNGANGFDIYSYGAVTTYGVYSRMNFASGAYIDNCDGAMSCSAPAALPVTMNGDNFFISNVDTNLWVNSRGAITVNNLTAHFSSTGNGAYLNNRYSNAAAPVTLKGYARASNNQLDNIVIYSNGAVSAANVTANNSLTLYGMYIQNDTALMPGVILTGYNTFNNNKGIGIYIRSYGAVFASNLTASYNGNPNPSYGAQIINNGGPAPRPVTISGVNTFNGNFSSGLFVNSYGAITVSNVTAKYNSNGSGVVLYNQHGLYIQPVTISVYGVFEGNASDGLSVESNGNVTMANLTGNNNQGYGVFVNSSNAGASSVSANVTLTGNNFFRGNVSGSGLYITNDGNITVSNVTALSNGFYGARLDNSTLAGVGEVKNIAVNGVNNFYFNAGLAGLGVFSSGGATLTRIQSGSNYDSGGATTNGLYANVVGTLTLSCGKFTGNEGAGYNLNAAVVKLLGFLSNNNGAADWVAAGMVTQTKVCPLP